MWFLSSVVIKSTNWKPPFTHPLDFQTFLRPCSTWCFAIRKLATEMRHCTGSELAFQVRFLEELKTQKRHFEINSPLLTPRFSDLPKALLDLMFCDQKTCNGNETLHKKWIGLKGVKFFCENAFVKILQPCQRIKCNLVFSFDLSYM